MRSFKIEQDYFALMQLILYVLRLFAKGNFEEGLASVKSQLPQILEDLGSDPFVLQAFHRDVVFDGAAAVYDVKGYQSIMEGYKATSIADKEPFSGKYLEALSNFAVTGVLPAAGVDQEVAAPPSSRPDEQIARCHQQLFKVHLTNTITIYVNISGVP